MQFFTGKNSWPPNRSEKRKLGNGDSPIDDEGRKRPKAVKSVSRTDGSKGRDSEESPRSPSPISDAQQSKATLDSLPSPMSIHFAPRSVSHNNTSKTYPPTPLSRSPDRIAEDVTSDALESSTLHQAKSASRAQSPQSFDAPTRPKPPQIDTARAVNDLDPRSPGYSLRGIASDSVKGKRVFHQQGSQDRDQRSSDPLSRRQSEAMLPPPSTSINQPRSESSTPNTSTPVTATEPMLPATASFDPSRRRISSSRAPSISTGVKDMASPKATAPQNQPPLPHNFSGFAQSIMLTTSANIKLDNMKGFEAENAKESRRHEKYNVAYASLVDLTNSDFETIRKTKTRRESQFESYIIKQDVIANSLGVHSAQHATPLVKEAVVDSSAQTQREIANLHKEVANLREDLRELRHRLSDQKEKSVRHKDLDKFALKTNSHHDLRIYVSKDELKKELLDFEDTLASRASGFKALERKIVDLFSVTGKRHQDVQDIQQKNHTQFQDLEHSITTEKDEARKRNSDTDVKLAELSKSLHCQIADSTSLKGHLDQLQAAHTSLKTSLHGDSASGEPGFGEVIESLSERVSQLKTLHGQIQEKITILEEKTTKDSAPTYQPIPTHSFREADELMGNLRHDLSEVVNAIDELKREFELIADDVDSIRQDVVVVTDKYDRSKGERRSNSQSIQPTRLPNEVDAATHMDDSTSLGSIDRVKLEKLEKLENDLQALDVVTKSQQLKFDNLTTEDLARNIIHQTKQLYKEHPGHVQDVLKILEEQQRKVDAYITTNLEPRLSQYETQAQEDLSTIRKELSEMRSKYAELANISRARYDKVLGDVEVLGKEIYAKAAPDNRERLLASLKHKDHLKLDNVERAAQSNSVDPSEGTFYRAPVASMSSSRQESIASGRNGRGPESDDESDVPMSQRKRKRLSLPKVTDDEDEKDRFAHRRAAGKGPR